MAKKEEQLGAPAWLYKLLILMFVALLVGSCAAGFAIGGGADIRLFSDGNTTRQVKILSIEWR